MNRHLRALLAAATCAGLLGALVGAAALGPKWPEYSENVPLLTRELVVLLAFGIAAWAVRPAPETRVTGSAAVGVFAAAVGRSLLLAFTIGGDWRVDGFTSDVGWKHLATSSIGGLGVLVATVAQTLALTAAVVATNRRSAARHAWIGGDSSAPSGD